METGAVFCWLLVIKPLLLCFGHITFCRHPGPPEKVWLDPNKKIHPNTVHLRKYFKVADLETIRYGFKHWWNQGLAAWFFGPNLQPCMTGCLGLVTIPSLLVICRNNGQVCWSSSGGFFLESWPQLLLKKNNCSHRSTIKQQKCPFFPAPSSRGAKKMVPFNGCQFTIP